MAFIDTTPASFQYKITEDNIQPKLADLLTNVGGWNTGKNSTALAANFKKVVFDAMITNPNFSHNEQTIVQIAVAEHFIYKNNEGQMFGLAIVGEWEQAYGLLGKDPNTDTLHDFGVWATNQFRKYRSPQTLYFYMVEDLKGLESITDDIVIGWQAGTSNAQVRRAALDIEVTGTTWVTLNSGSPIFQVSEAEVRRMQSPIVQAGLRTTLLEEYYDASLHANVAYTNWWNDSEISFRGHLDDKSFFFIVQADNVPAPEGNLVPIIPLYFGKLEAVEEGDNAYALFAGSVPPASTGGTIQSQLDSISHYDFDDPKTRVPNIMPLLKTYPKYPASGVDSVMVSRSKFGARYQAYYLSWNAPSNLIPPARTDGTGNSAKDYPRAWNNAENPLYKYSFNPSRYSGKVHTSKVYVVHPEEGVRGALRNTIALSALTFNANKLRVKKQNCPDQFDVYRYFLVEGVSPMTKRPGTTYRPAGIGLLVNTVDNEGNEVTPPVTP